MQLFLRRAMHGDAVFLSELPIFLDIIPPSPPLLRPSSHPPAHPPRKCPRWRTGEHSQGATGAKARASEQHTAKLGSGGRKPGADEGVE